MSTELQQNIEALDKHLIPSESIIPNVNELVNVLAFKGSLDHLLSDLAYRSLDPNLTVLDGGQ
ncbi:16167_t:CDS:2, partial [Funneliformis mosseae]